MTNREECIKVVNEMVEHGFHLVGETAEEFVKRYEIPGFDTLSFLRNMLENVKKW